MKLLSWGNQFLLHTLLVGLSFWATAAIGMLINPQSFHKFFFLAENALAQVPTSRSLSYYWDIQPYADLALNRACSAFYPLWPSLIDWLYAPTSLEQAARGFLITATALFMISLPMALLVFRTALQNKHLALGVTLLYTLSPLAIFRVIGYTESLFGLVSLGLLLLLLHPNKLRQRAWLLLLIFTLAAILSLTRPALVQITGACLATLVTLATITALQLRPQTPLSRWKWMKGVGANTLRRSPLIIPISLSLGLGAFSGYAIYGLFCWKTTGSFWQPFLLQQSWNKSLGLRPWLLLSSRSPLIDLLGLYLPFLCWVVALTQVMAITRGCTLLKHYGGRLGTVLMIYPPLWILVQAWGNRGRLFRFNAKGLKILEPDAALAQENSPPAWLYSYGFWFALYFAAAHSGIAGLTQDRLVSLGRYIFAQPFIFLVIGYLYPSLSRPQRPWLLPLVCGISALCLVEQWISYGYHKWLG
jgi:hypothetical protein